jgi:hypothetical protein
LTAFSLFPAGRGTEDDKDAVDCTNLDIVELRAFRFMGRFYAASLA